MAGETTYSLISAFLPDIWEMALMYARTNFVMPRLSRVFNDRTGKTPRKITEYVETGVTDNLGETTDLDTVTSAFNRALLATLTPKEIGKQYFITDIRVETDDVASILADAAMDLGYTMGKKIEQDLLAEFAGFSGGIFGSEANAFSLDLLYKGRARLEAQNIPGPYITVLHPYQYLDMVSAWTNLSNPAPLEVRNTAQAVYYVTRVADMQIIVHSLVPKTAVANEVQTITEEAGVDGGTFTLTFAGQTTAALAWDITAANLELALEGLANIGTGNVSVAGAGGGPYTVTFQGDLAGENVPELVGTSSLTDGGVPESITIATTTQGSNYANSAIYSRDALAFDLRRGIRIEPQRDASRRGVELNATAVYAAGEWRHDRGVVLRSDASAPLN